MTHQIDNQCLMKKVTNCNGRTNFKKVAYLMDQNEK